jgi:trans-aconitate methyltransferase
MTQQEFDAHAKRYDAVLDDSISFSGEDSAYFAEYKIRDLHRELVAQGVDVRAALRILDFGCGVGSSIPHLRQYFAHAELYGVDVSEESLDLARSRHANLARFLKMSGTGFPQGVEALDAAYAMCVFHHIDEQQHIELLSGLRSRLKPNALLMVYEHNPLNPLTVRVVNNCIFDINAKLIGASLMAERCRRAGFRKVSVKYRVFFPSFLKFFRFAEGLFAWLPLGGQYYVRCLA